MARNSARDTLVQNHQRRHLRLIQTLQHRFPTTCRGRVEDAVAEAWTSALERPLLLDRIAQASERESHRLLYQIAWRNLRGQRRKRAFRQEGALNDDLLDAGPPGWADHSPEDAVVAIELCDHLRALIPEAAAHFGGRQSAPLSRALMARITDGQDDASVANDHHIPREYLNRAKSWMGRQVA